MSSSAPIKIGKPENIDPNLWYIRGKAYDLSTFLDRHPGGRDILAMSKGKPDATPLFESYHAFSNLKYINKTLEEYRHIPDDLSVSTDGSNEGLDGESGLPVENQLYTFNKGEFYDVLRTRVRAHFGADSESVSVSRRVKATASWRYAVKVLLQMSIFISCFIYAFDLHRNPTEWFSLEHNENWMSRSLSALVAGVVFIQLGFCVMHDASHFALFPAKYQWMNEYASRAWNAFALWHHELWTLHHSVMHHSYTGSEFDPDIRFSNPFVRKNPKTSRSNALNVAWIVERFGLAGWCAYVFLFLCVPPGGMWLGQAFAYWAIWRNNGHLWKMGLPPADTLKRHWWEVVLSTVAVTAHLKSLDLRVSFAFALALNVAYCMNILPDHDGLETVENAEELNATWGNDWGHVQVTSSADFGTGGFDLWARLNGGINYQCVHHVFPNVCHEFYPEIAPIVKQTCAEFDVAYVEYPTVLSACLDFVRTVRSLMTGDDESDTFTKLMDERKAIR